MSDREPERYTDADPQAKLGRAIRAMSATPKPIYAEADRLAQEQAAETEVSEDESGAREGG